MVHDLPLLVSSQVHLREVSGLNAILTTLIGSEGGDVIDDEGLELEVTNVEAEVG